MIRQVDIREISDGKLYRSSDMVRLDTKDCAGCSACCHGMDNKIILDPYDLYRLNAQAGWSFDSLLACGAVSLGVAEGLVLPSLSMDGPDRACHFLDADGRCSIHAARPGICRLFPLGRYYQGEDFSYILQVGECDRTRTKVRISKWLGTPELARYEAYIRRWHALYRRAVQLAENASDQMRKMISMEILKTLYRYPWDVTESFYPQYEDQEALVKQKIGIL